MAPSPLKQQDMKRPAVLLANDLHVDKNCIQAFCDNWDDMISVCVGNDVCECIIGGDLFTSRSSQTLDVLMAVKRCIEIAERHDITLTIALGNHDLCDQGVTYGYPSLFDVYDHVTIVNNEPYFRKLGGGMFLVVMRYWNEVTAFPGKMAELDGILKQKGISRNDVILYVHEGIHGGLGDFDAPNEVPQDVFSGFAKVLSGHYHNRKKIDGTNIEYIGSTRQKDFGEDESKGYTLLYDDGSYKFIENDVNGRFITLERNYEDLSDKFLETVSGYRDDGYCVRVKVNCTDSQAKTIDKQPLFSAGVTKIEVVTEDAVKGGITEDDLGKKFDKGGIQSEYGAYCDRKGVSSELGMKYLNRI